MEDQLISFETAKLAKEKEFDVLCEHSFSKHGSNIQENDQNGFRNWNKEYKNSYSRPTQSLLQKWLREVHNCFIDILPHKDGDSKNKQWRSKEDVFWTVEVDYYGKDFKIELTDDSDFTQHFNNNYEEALEIGLYQALKLIK